MQLFLFLPLLGFLCWFLTFILICLLNKWRTKSEFKKLQQNLHKKELQSWASTPKIQDLLSSYIKMVVKHGPDSDEANVFRLTIENKQFIGDQECLNAFNTVADIFVENYKRYRK